MSSPMCIIWHNIHKCLYFDLIYEINVLKIKPDQIALKRVKLESSPEFGENEDDYCVVCQGDHKIKTSCFLCKTCGARGHLARDCGKEYSEVVIKKEPKDRFIEIKNEPENKTKDRFIEIKHEANLKEEEKKTLEAMLVEDSNSNLPPICSSSTSATNHRGQDGHLHN